MQKMRPQYRYLVLVLLLCLPLMATAQKKKRAATAKPAVEEPPVDPRLERMTMNTQRIVFIDSMLVPRSDMLSHIKLTPQTGIIRQEQQGYSYQNEIGTRRISVVNNRLCASELVNGAFDEPQELKGLYNAGIIDTLDCPFLMNDGLTLYFAAKGSESIGGYDIFVSRYNLEARQFLKPENIGMPFNSKADDLLYIIDEELNIGYFATTRNQPNGYVCIYSFVPSGTRQTYDNTTPEQLKQLAALHSIRDTWGDGQERDKALKRLEDYHPQPTATEPVMSFVINDEVTYSSPKQFQSAENRQLYQQLLDLQEQDTQLSEELQTSRTLYEHATAVKRNRLKGEILESEAKLLQLRKDIHELEKRIRNSENQKINH